MIDPKVEWVGRKQQLKICLVWNLHKRIALFVLNKVGTKPPLLLAGFMGTTSFISMWMSNVASTAMMAPIGSVKDLVHYAAYSA